jgi:glycine betaine/proline transport system permease protein
MEHNRIARTLYDAGAMRWTTLALGLVFILLAVLVQVGDRAPWLHTFPRNWTLPITTWFGDGVGQIVALSQGLARAVSTALSVPMLALKDLLLWAPWSVVVLSFTLAALVSGGLRLALFTVFSFVYVLAVGHWLPTMNTLALVGLAIPIAVMVGFAVGVLAEGSPRIDRLVQPALDLMQTVPAFAYLIPILLIFGFGPVVGLITSIIYAVPPMVRNTILGLQRVPQEQKESARMGGCTPWQEFWLVRVPAAKPQLMVGLNQTTMAAFSMIIIASVIGGFQDIGWEVLSTMRKAQFGQSAIAGVVIALLAMVFYRITAGFANRETVTGQVSDQRYLSAPVAVVAIFTTLVLSSLFDALWQWPDAWVVRPAEALNQAVDWITANYGPILDSFKRTTLYYFLLPLKVGLVQTISPSTWGISFTTGGQIFYWVLVVMSAIAARFYLSGALSATILIIGVFLYYGALGLPWPVFITIVSLIAFQVGGLAVAAFALSAQLFILLSGFWQSAMMSLYLVVAAVTICIAVGISTGIAASRSDMVSAVLKPINDSLQTIPQFVLLIPVLMFFRAGDFTALLAIILYAIVPAIRYTEAGLRNVPTHLIEAGRSMGCTPGQLFWQVQLPQALPEILLGINQTIMFALAMLVIAALVGTTDLGQEVYIALGKADAGRGLVAGIGMALIAMTADRILQSAASKQRAALGLR